MGTIKPNPKLLTIWRLTLAVIMCVPAFLTSLFLRFQSTAWLWSTLAWILVFLVLYLVYLPLCYRAISFSVSGERILLYKGVLYTQSLAASLERVQFTYLSAGPLEKVFGLCSLVVVMAGGRLVLHGLRRQDADNLAAALGDRR